MTDIGAASESLEVPFMPVPGISATNAQDAIQAVARAAGGWLNIAMTDASVDPAVPRTLYVITGASGPLDIKLPINAVLNDSVSVYIHDYTSTVIVTVDAGISGTIADFGQTHRLGVQHTFAVYRCIAPQQWFIEWDQCEKELRYRTSNAQIGVMHGNSLLYMDSSLGARTITVPSNATDPLPIGFQTEVMRYGVNSVTLVVDTGVTISADAPLALPSQFSRGVLTKINPDEWSWNAYGPSLYTPPETGGVTRSISSKLDDVPSIEDFGSVTGDATATIQAALNYGGRLLCRSRAYTIGGVLNTTVPFWLLGQGSNTHAARTLFRFTAADSADRFVIGDGTASFGGVHVEGITFAATNATGGSIFFLNYGNRVSFDYADFFSLGQTQDAIKVHRCNTVRLRGLAISSTTRSGIYAYSSDSGSVDRTDVIELIDINIDGDAGGAGTHIPDALLLDGIIDTVSIHSVRAINCGRGIHTQNTLGAPDGPAFIIAHDFECDYPQNECILDDAGYSLWFHNTYLHGSRTGRNVVINNRTPTNDNIQFIGGKCTGAALAGMYLNGRFTTVSDMEVSGNSLASSGTYPGIQIGADSIGTRIIGNHSGARTGRSAGSHSYGVQIDAGAQRYCIEGNDLVGNIVGAINDLAQDTYNSRSIIANNLGVTQNPQTIITASPYNALNTDDIIFINLASPGICTINLPSVANRGGKPIRVVDVAGTAYTYNHAINRTGSDVFAGGATSFTFYSAFQAQTFVPVTVGGIGTWAVM